MFHFNHRYRPAHTSCHFPNRLHYLFDIIFNIIQNPKSIDSLHVTNYHGHKICLDQPLVDIIHFLCLKHIDLNDFDHLNDSDIVLFKLQLWLEEQILTFDDNSLNLSLNYRKILDKLHKKFDNILFTNLVKKHPILKGHIFQRKVILLYVIVYLIYFQNHYNNIMHTNFCITIAKQYVYRYIYYPYRTDNHLNGDNDKLACLTFDNFLESHNINSELLFKIGSQFILPFINLGYIELYLKASNNVYGLVLLISEDLANLLKECSIVDTINMPMISKPLNWRFLNNEYIGGNYRHDISRLTFIHYQQPHNHRISNLNTIINNVNHMQSQAMTINNTLLNYLLANPQLLDTESDINNFIISLAKAYRQVKFYIPIYIDWRGRLYTASSILSYQGTPLAKCLILLDYHLTIDTKGREGLMLFTANCYGLSKESNNNKLKWFNDKHNVINKLDLDLMLSAVDKYDFINCCLIWHNLNKDSSNIDNILVRFDATCSGIQHISALLEDMKLGIEVNLGPSDDNSKPNDIYTKLIPLVKESLHNMILEDVNLLKDHSILLKFPITRNIIKRPIMTIPYAASIMGIADQIRSLGLYVKDVNGNISFEFYDQDNNIYSLTNKDIYLLSHVIYKTINQEFPVLKILFKYYREMTSLLFKLNIPIEWTTPIGVKIEQEYIKTEDEKIVYSIGKKVKTVVLKKPVIPTVKNIHKSKNAIIPNIIHSLDSTHLNLIVGEFIKLQLPILTIHDCFIVNPNHWEILRDSVINMYISLYSNQQFINIYHQQCLDKINENYITSVYDNNLVVSEYGYVIPENPYKQNKEFFNSLKKSIYLIK
jgi:hypothetical protein